MCSNRSESQHDSIAVIQHISIWWSKSSRGGELAEKRNKIPRAFPLSAMPPIYDGRKRYLVHKIHFDEHNQFNEPLREVVETPIIETFYNAVNCRVEVDCEMPIVKFQWLYGAPMRVHAKAFPVEENEWVQVEYNARFSCRDSGIWSYSHDIINVAAIHPENRNIFVASEPTTTHRELAHLW